MASSGSGSGWEKSPAELVAAFGEALDRFPDAVRRPMFGYPAAFVNGNMWTGLFQTRWVIRLPDADRDELLGIEGAAAFEPMPGRSMRGYAVLPRSVLADPVVLNGWLERAWTAALALPPKEAGARKKR
jgi:hypothetical protein